jgi:hypothetical protein
MIRSVVLSARAPAVLALALALALAVRVVGAPTPALAEDPPAGHIETVQGSAAIVRDGASVPARPDAPLLIGDMVVTGEAGKVVIALRGGGTLTAGPGSRFNVADYARDGTDDRGLFGMLAGIMRASLDPDHPWDRFDVQSRTAVASARNTEFIVEATPLNTAVVTLSGRVGVVPTAPAAAGQAVDLGPGEGTDVALGAAPKDPVTWGEARVRAFLARTTLP